jgi:spore maturation protein CgeB
MKLVRLSTAYPDYLKSFYGSRLGLEDEPFSRQMETLMYDGFGWADFWKNALEPLGYSVEEIVANAESIQRAWARENGMRQPGRDWLLRLAAKRVEAVNPDVLFVTDYITFSRAWIDELRSRCPSLRLVLGWCGAPYVHDHVFRAYDIILSNLPELVDKFGEMGLKSRHLMHAFDPRILSRIPEDGLQVPEFTFVGQIVRYEGFHRERERLLIELAGKSPLIIFSPSYNAGLTRTLGSLARWAIRTTWKAARNAGFSERFLGTIPVLRRGHRYLDRPPLPVHPSLWSHLRPPVYGLEMFRVLKNSKTTLNNHIGLSERAASNMRLFEATGVGTCLITDFKDNLDLFFDMDREIVTYRSPEECVEKVRYLLDHSVERESIARSGQKRTLRDHNFSVRAHRLDEIIKQAMIQ